MRTVSDDLTAPARIRNAAMHLWSEQGFGVGLRAVADRADVSLGLIRHHFGSKEGLREACDTAVLSELERLQETDETTATDAAGTLLEQFASLDAYRPLVEYIVQTLIDGGASGRRFWDRLLADSERYLAAAVAGGVVRPTDDPAGRARFLTLIELGGLVVAKSLAPDGEEFAVTWRRYVDTVAGPALELYTHGLLADTSLLEAYRGQAAADPGPDSHRGEQDR